MYTPGVLENTPAGLLIERNAGPISVLVGAEDIARGASWRICRSRHTLVAHLGGPIMRIETDLDGVPVSHKPLGPGEVTIIPAGTRYEAFAEGGLVRYCEARIPATGDLVFPQAAATASVTPGVGLPDAFLFHSLRRLAEAAVQAGDLDDLLSQSLAIAIGAHVAKAYGGPAAAPIPTDPLGPRAARRVADYIEANLAQKITLADLAKVGGLPANRFLAAFKDRFGRSPIQYLIGRRLARARDLLSGTCEDLTSIALATGFGSHSHFTTVFRRHVGIAPGAYRRRFA